MNIFFLLFSGLAFASITFDADKPLETKTFELGPSEYIEDKTQLVRMVCEVYPKLAIQTMIDPGLKGTSYKLVVRHKNEKVDEVCSAKTKLRTFNIHAGVMPGMANDILVVTSEEPLGEVDFLIFYDTKTGGQIHSMKFHASKPVTIKKSGNNLSVDYHAFLGGPRENCNVIADKTCFRKVLKRNQVPDPDSFSAPDCSVAMKFNPKDTAEGSVDLFLEASIADVRKPMVEWKGKTITCSVAP